MFYKIEVIWIGTTPLEELWVTGKEHRDGSADYWSPQNTSTIGISVDAAIVINVIATMFIQMPERTIWGIVK